MNTAQTKGIRIFARCVENTGNFQVRKLDKQGKVHVIAFNLSKEKAEYWMKFFQGSYLEEVK
jgi:hypothetical protein